ncbi:Cytosolic iron-sulfur protein assembly protein [Ascosphaera aggregata]|nr:Cytosolic iron-sulfur protein assembly protein [Ascosphaera aggregata]
MTDTSRNSMPRLEHLGNLSPSTLGRQWSSFPHPRLPLVAVCGADRTVRIYSLINFCLLTTISGGHNRSVRSCAWKPGCNQEIVLATGSFDATVGIWKRSEVYENEGAMATCGSAADRKDEEDQWRFAVLLDGHESEVKSVAWSSSGSLLATCSRDKSIWIWEDLEDGDDNFETVAVLQEHAADVKCLMWHPNEDCLASGSYDNTIRIWREDADDWEYSKAEILKEPTSEESTWEPGFPRLVSASDDCTVRIWRRIFDKPLSQNASNMPSIIRPADIDETWVEEVSLPKVHDLTIYSVTWSKRTGIIASAGADGRIALYEETGQNPQPEANNEEHNSRWRVISVLEAAHDEYEVNQVIWADRKGGVKSVEADEELLLSTGDDGSVKVWRLANKTTLVPEALENA